MNNFTPNDDTNLIQVNICWSWHASFLLYC